MHWKVFSTESDAWCVFSKSWFFFEFSPLNIRKPKGKLHHHKTQKYVFEQITWGFTLQRHKEINIYFRVLLLLAREREIPGSRSDYYVWGFNINIKCRDGKENKTKFHKISKGDNKKGKGHTNPRRMTIPGHLLCAITCSLLTNTTLRASPFISTY